MNRRAAVVCLVAVLVLPSVLKAQTASGAQGVRYGFTVDWSRERVGSKVNPGAKTTEGELIESTTSNTYVGHAKITNRSSATLENLEVHIQMHYKAAQGKAVTDEQKTSIKKLPPMRQNETVIVDTDPLTLKILELKGGFAYLDGTPNRQTESIRGAIVTLFHDGKQVFEYVSNPALKSLAGKTKPASASK